MLLKELWELGRGFDLAYFSIFYSFQSQVIWKNIRHCGAVVVRLFDMDSEQKSQMQTIKWHESY